MNKHLIISLSLLLWANVYAQPNISFQHLTTANGLSYSGVKDLCTDKSGNLWIATGNGLNMFNGKTVTKYYATDYPELGSNNLIALSCDDRNRIWVLTEQRTVLVIDEHRKMHKVVLGDAGSYFRVRALIISKSNNPVLFTEKGFFMLKDFLSAAKDSLGNNDFTSFKIGGFDTLMPKRFKHVFWFDADRYFFSQDTVLFILDFKTRQVQKKCFVPNGNLLIRWDDNNVLFCNTGTEELQLYNFTTGQLRPLAENLHDQFGKTPDAYFVYAEQLDADRLMLTTSKQGLYIYNKRSGLLFNYRHSPSNAYSIGSNEVDKTAFSHNGWAFVVTIPNGISYFNSKEIVSSQYVFESKDGHVYDGHITGIATLDNDIYYLGTGDGLIEWKRSNNTSSFPDFTGSDGKLLLQGEEIQTLCFDDEGKLWVSTTTKGLLVIGRNKQLLKHIKNTGIGAGSTRIRRAYILANGKDGYMWASGEGGICRINAKTLEPDYLTATPLAQLDRNFVSPIFFDHKKDIWIGVTDGGVWHYEFSSGKLEKLNKDNGLLTNYIFSISEDTDGNIFIGTNRGLNILTAKHEIKSVTTKDGLLISRIEALLPGHDGKMWIGNDISLACYSSRNNLLTVFDERYGLSIYGYRVNAYYQNSKGEFVFGTPKGIQYFFPEQLFGSKINLNTLISNIESKDINSGITSSSTFALPHDNNYVTFTFNTVDYSSHLNTFYSYKLEGNDKDWTVVTNQNAVHYSSLQPGTYVFKVRVSGNNKDWQDAANEVTVIVEAPFWKTWWFRLLGLLVSAAAIVYVVNFYRRQQKHRQAELETELVITYFASQINKHTKVDSLLWDIARNCISQLHFEDCVIYLLDESTNMLVQKAAWGPKSVDEENIKSPIQIPLGKGIVGAVAQSGKAEIVNDTTLDKRYIVDDDVRYSEITVPIQIDGKVIGIIDSESKRRHFFTERHLKILTTIAALCAGQFQLVKAEEEKKKAEIELLQNKQKVLESRLQSLRLQMNPHFLFNALNSVQQMILANEEMIATRYLSRFSKLLRAILVHSDKETITLKEELDILNLYIELESIRFKGAFSYTIHCDESIDTDEIKVPTLLIQPFVENAIWHGLMHKESDRVLRVEFSEKGEWLHCIVEDNGVGRQKAREIKGISVNGDKHQSKGIAVSTERLRSMKSSDGVSGTIAMHDLYDENGNPAGTKVEIIFPVLN